MSGFHLIVEFVGAVALLLWGVRMVRTGMTRAFGAVLRRALTACSRNRFTAFGAGVFVTGLLQSSTATALLLSSFAGRGLVALPVALAVMLGANVGTAVTAQVFSFDVYWLASAAVAVGVFTFMAGSGDRVRHLGRIAIGLGLMLLSLQLLGAAIAPIQQSPVFLSVLGALHDQPILAFLIAAAVTWLVHSSLSMILLVMSLAAAGVIALPVALAMVLGANVGGAVGPYIDQAGGQPAARRVALGNLAMRFLSALAVLFVTPQLVPLLAMVEPSPARVIVNFHLVFNIAASIVGLPLIGVVSWACMRLLPDAPVAADPGLPRYLDPHALDTPGEALACAMRETLRLGDHIEVMLRQSIDVFERDDARMMKEVERADDAVDRLYEAIKLYLIGTSRAELSLEESSRAAEILTFVTNLEHVGDIIDKNLMELAAKKIKNRWAFSSEGMAELRAFHGLVLDNLRLAFNVFATRDLALARRLMAGKTALREAEHRAAESHFARLREGRPESIETSSVHMDVVRDLKRINGHLASVAYPILEAAGELADTRLRSGEENGVSDAIDRGKPAVP
ncbi:Na/Pi cotransporter family protein [Vineibacter terrae]|uniref:Na/Pi cotransporter family protein n=1 Tax=Vineibacter terrae TaxID=2586908 RepID=UPI002E31E78A|nr:Na/Pi cotransporter family protein [Vineibacter terrae]HEX2889855.1 Na/Pi cotransporter family protein [Vineibacter terrae]